MCLVWVCAFVSTDTYGIPEDDTESSVPGCELPYMAAWFRIFILCKTACALNCQAISLASLK